MSQFTHFAKGEFNFSGNASPQADIIKLSVPPGLQKRLIYCYIAINPLSGLFNYIFSGAVHLRRGGTDMCVPLPAGVANVPGNILKQSEISVFLAGGSAVKDSIIASMALGWGSQPAVVVQPFEVTAQIDEITFSLDNVVDTNVIKDIQGYFVFLACVSKSV